MPRLAAHPEQIDGVVVVPLTRGDVAIIDLADLDLVRPYNWTSNGRYAATLLIGRTSYLHRVIMGLQPGERIYVDHINGDSFDNRRSNLRCCSHDQNLRNMRKVTPHSSRFKGVSWRKDTKRWTAHAHLFYKKINLGCFDTEEEAAAAYDAFVRQHYGEYGRPNAA